MTKVNTYLHALNVGVHDKTALARVDLERMRLAAEVQTNILPQAVGPASFRPGFEFLRATKGNAEVRVKEFVFGAADASLMEFSNLGFRVLVDDQLITRAAVSSTVTNGDFSSGAGWSTTGIGGGAANITGGKLILNATAIEGIAQCGRSVSTSSPNVEHALRIVVERGPVLFRCGSNSGGDQYIEETFLPTGTHSLAFTPTGSYYVQFASRERADRIVDSIEVEAAGVMDLPTPWPLASLHRIRIAQSANVCFVACDGYQQRRIERRGARSWSVCLYQSNDGPFPINPSQRVRLKPSALEGNTTLTSSVPYFTPSDVGRLYRLSHNGQRITQRLAQEDVYTDAIRVTGLDEGGTNDRNFTLSISGTWSGTLWLQRSYDGEDTGFVQTSRSYTANGSDSVSDGADNAIYFYRLGFLPGGYTSGTAVVSISYDGGGGFGICRVTGYNSSTSVDVEVLTPFKNTNYTRVWDAGEWSNRTSWPSAVALSDGRLWWSGEDRVWGSVSDAFDSFDDETEGDSGPISRSIATGGVNDTKWLLSLDRLLAGTEGAVATVKSSSLDEPLTPTNFGIRDTSTTGVADVDPIKVDTRGIFVERAGTALMELTSPDGSPKYIATQISKLTTDIFKSGVKSLAVQRRPDTRIWLVLNDGSCVCMVYEADQDVLAFVPMETDGAFESVAVLPSLKQDRVYFTVRRESYGATVRYIEKMAADDEVTPDTLCRCVDSFKVIANAPASATVSGLSHLIGRDVVVWADGAPIEVSEGVPATFTVPPSGIITLPIAVSSAVVGLPYRGRYKSSRLAYGAVNGTAMLQKKTVNSVGMILTDFHRDGIKLGHDFEQMHRLPKMINSQIAPKINLGNVHDEEPVVFNGNWDTDSRVCMEINSPYPATVCSLVFDITTN